MKQWRDSDGDTCNLVADAGSAMAQSLLEVRRCEIGRGVGGTARGLSIYGTGLLGVHSNDVGRSERGVSGGVVAGSDSS